MDKLEMWAVTHVHDHGTDSYLFLVEFGLFPEQTELVEKLGIDFEEDKGETLVLSEVRNYDNFPTFTSE